MSNAPCEKLNGEPHSSATDGGLTGNDVAVAETKAGAYVCTVKLSFFQGAFKAVAKERKKEEDRDFKLKVRLA